MKIRLDGEDIYEGAPVLCAVANGAWFGGGMHVAPAARLDDGLLDVVIVSQVSKPGLVARLPSLYRGTHVEDPIVSQHRGRVLEAAAEPGTVPLEVDGDPLGTLPIRVELLPGALSLLGPAKDEV